MHVDREKFISFIKESGLINCDKPVHGHTISVMQYIKDGKLQAYAKYDKTDGPCLVSYVICDI